VICVGLCLMKKFNLLVVVTKKFLFNSLCPKHRILKNGDSNLAALIRLY
jgi:hypothetical protein